MVGDRPTDQNPRKRSHSDDKVDRLFAGIILAEAIKAGATRQELIDLAIKHRRLDVVKKLTKGTL
jgi:hypothetical protein